MDNAGSIYLANSWNLAVFKMETFKYNFHQNYSNIWLGGVVFHATADVFVCRIRSLFFLLRFDFPAAIADMKAIATILIVVVVQVLALFFFKHTPVGNFFYRHSFYFFFPEERPNSGVLTVFEKNRSTFEDVAKSLISEPCLDIEFKNKGSLFYRSTAELSEGNVLSENTAQDTIKLIEKLQLYGIRKRSNKVFFLYFPGGVHFGDGVCLTYCAQPIGLKECFSKSNYLLLDQHWLFEIE